MTDTQLYIAKRDYLKLSSIAALDFSLYDTTHKTNRGTVFTPGTLIGIFRDETDGTTTPLTSLFICRALSGKRWLTQREVETLYLVS